MIIDDIKKIFEEQKKSRRIKEREKKIKKIHNAIEGMTDEQKLKKLQQEDLTILEESVIVKNIKSPHIRMKALEIIKDFEIQQEIIESFDSDDLKLQALNFVENGKVKIEIIKNMKAPEYVLKALPLVSNDSRVEIILGINNDEFKLKALKLIPKDMDWKKEEIIKTMTNGRTIIQALKENRVYEKKNIIIEKMDSFDDEEKKQLLELYEYDLDDDTKIIIIKKIKDNLIRLSLLDLIERKSNGEEKRKLIIELIDDTEVKQLIERMTSKNAELLKNIDFRLFDRKFLDTLGEDRINLISCYPEIQKNILQLNDSQLYIFDRCIDIYLEEHPGIDEWTILANEILKNINAYKELFSSLGKLEDVKELTDEDIIALTKIIQNENLFEIKNMNDVRNIEQIREKKFDDIMEGQYPLSQKKEALTKKIFGFSLDYLRKCIMKYGIDIENIDDGYAKDFIRALKEIEDIEDEKVLKEIYDACSMVEIDKTLIERDLKTEYGKKFNEGLYKVKEEDLVENTENIYEAGTDFKILMTAVGSYSGINPEDYKEDWNRPAIGSQHFCASYIRNDMIGTSPIQNICYGFSTMKDDALMLSSHVDIGSSAKGFISSSVLEETYFTPDNQINHTETYNEMDFRRIQGGEKKQPDYILVFKKNGIIPNMEEAQKASKQWGGMPIVIVDVDKCLSAERKKVEEMIKKYYETNSIEIAIELLQKVKNNRVTDLKFCEDLNSEIGMIREDIKYLKKNNYELIEEEKQTIGIESLEENYENVSEEERKKVYIKIRKLYREIQEIKKGKNSDGR